MLSTFHTSIKNSIMINLNFISEVATLYTRNLKDSFITTVPFIFFFQILTIFTWIINLSDYTYFDHQVKVSCFCHEIDHCWEKCDSAKQVVAVKQLNRAGLQGNREFLVEVLMLSLLHHSNLVNLIGYCADGDQRILVYEFMPLGSLEHHLHGIIFMLNRIFGIFV